MAGDNGQARRLTLNVVEAASRIEIKRNKAYEMIRQGTFPLPIIRVGKRCVVPAAAVEEYLAHRS